MQKKEKKQCQEEQIHSNNLLMQYSIFLQLFLIVQNLKGVQLEGVYELTKNKTKISDASEMHLSQMI